MVSCLEDLWPPKRRWQGIFDALADEEVQYSMVGLLIRKTGE
jgi:hypothetical protein